ncbi:MAG TPA: transporter [Bryobacteraceae bacterium]|nr:transporter [Bryobacteraceae bacterium]
MGTARCLRRVEVLAGGRHAIVRNRGPGGRLQAESGGCGRYSPSLAVLTRLSLPYGSDEHSSRGYDPGVTLAWARSLRAGFEVAGNFNLDNLTINGKRAIQDGESVTVGHRFNQRWGTYCEVYTISAAASRDWVLNGGVTRNYGNLQLDLEAGHALTRSGTVWFFGVGFAYRRSLLAR